MTIRFFALALLGALPCGFVSAQGVSPAEAQNAALQQMYLQQEMQLKNEIAQTNLQIMQEENMLNNRQRELADAESDENSNPGGMAGMRVMSARQAVNSTQNYLMNLERRKTQLETQLAVVESRLN